MNRLVASLITTGVAVTAVAGTIVSTPGVAGAAGNYGPDTCLEGYVWREARPGDHVCVTPKTRTQTATDNGKAASRREPKGGAYGADTCKKGFVWREAFAGDHVCVIPAIRTQAATDNRRAAERKATLRLWLTHWYPAPKCTGGVCSKTSNDDLPHVRVNGAHFNVGGKVFVGFYRKSDNKLITSKTVTAKAHAGYAGGSFGVRTNLIDCARPGSKAGAVVKAYDYGSKRWSAPIPADVTCKVL